MSKYYKAGAKKDKLVVKESTWKKKIKIKTNKQTYMLIHNEYTHLHETLCRKENTT